MSCRRFAPIAFSFASLLVLAAPALGAAAYSLESELSVRETYDDNIDRVNENRRDEFVTTVGAGLIFRARSLRSTTSASYRVGVDFFAKETEGQGQVSHRGSLATSYQATRRLTLRLADTVRFARTTEPAASLAVPEPPPAPGPVPTPTEPPPAVEPGAVPTRRVQRLDNTVAAGFDYQYDALTLFTGGYSFKVVRFDAPDLIDRDTHGVDAAVTRQVARNDRAGVAYGFSWVRFDDPARADRRIHEAAATWQHVFSPTLTSQVGLGAVWVEGGGDDLGVAASAALTKLAGLTQYSARYRGTFTVAEGAGVLQRLDSVALGVARELSRTLTGRLGAAVSRSERLEDLTRPTYVYSAAAGLTARLTKSVRASVDYSFERKDAPAGEASFRNNRVTAGLTVLLPAFRSAEF